MKKYYVLCLALLLSVCIGAVAALKVKMGIVLGLG
jgi:hypothetical protein